MPAFDSVYHSRIAAARRVAESRSADSSRSLSRTPGATGLRSAPLEPLFLHAPTARSAKQIAIRYAALIAALHHIRVLVDPTSPGISRRGRYLPVAST